MVCIHEYEIPLVFVRSVPLIPYFLDILKLSGFSSPKRIAIFGANNDFVVGAFNLSRSTVVD